MLYYLTNWRKPNNRQVSNHIRLCQKRIHYHQAIKISYCNYFLSWKKEKLAELQYANYLHWHTLGVPSLKTRWCLLLFSSFPFTYFHNVPRRPPTCRDAMLLATPYYSRSFFHIPSKLPTAARSHCCYGSFLFHYVFVCKLVHSRSSVDPKEVVTCRRRWCPRFRNVPRLSFSGRRREGLPLVSRSIPSLPLRLLRIKAPNEFFSYTASKNMGGICQSMKLKGRNCTLCAQNHCMKMRLSKPRTIAWKWDQAKPPSINPN